MNRREFLKRMGLLGLVAVTPKIIFDVGKNLSKDNRTELIERELITPAYSVSAIQNTEEFKQVFNSIIQNIYDKKAMELSLRNGVFMVE